MAIDFPNAPTVGDTYTVGNRTWTWSGTGWEVTVTVGATLNKIKDADNDTKIQAEESADEDILRFDTAGTERMTIGATGDVTIFNNLDVSGNASATAFVGGLTGNVTGDLTGNVTGGDITGTLKSPYEKWNVVAGAPSNGASQPIDLLTSTAWYYTSNNTGPFELDFRGDASTTLDSLMAVGEAVTTSVLVTNGVTAYYNTNTLVDGSSVTVEWQNAAGPTAGNASQIDVYTFTIVKTASATFTVLGSNTTFG